MSVKRVMVTDIHTLSPTQHVGEALDIMHKHHLRMLPVVDEEGKIQGLFLHVYLIKYMVPEYIANGSLVDVSFAPDFGVLHQHYERLQDKPVADFMDTSPLIVQPDESLLGVSASLIACDCHTCALVADDEGRLLGMMTAGDLLDWLHKMEDETDHA